MSGGSERSWSITSAPSEQKMCIRDRADRFRRFQKQSHGSLLRNNGEGNGYIAAIAARHRHLRLFGYGHLLIITGMRHNSQQSTDRHWHSAFIAETGFHKLRWFSYRTAHDPAAVQRNPIPGNAFFSGKAFGPAEAAGPDVYKRQVSTRCDFAVKKATISIKNMTIILIFVGHVFIDRLRRIFPLSFDKLISATIHHLFPNRNVRYPFFAGFRAFLFC